ncbi:MAG TPA: HEAT repeat domain-containing protein, partial [Anaerolineales bacterium]|nr:HEAT repeat domain-containing protein [Anaerolineales bacterium]
MSKVDDYRRELLHAGDWRAYLMKNSGLPGPRGNLELAQAFAENADAARIESCLSIPVDEAPENSPQVFLVFCGITALGKMAAQGDRKQFRRLHPYASDSRWRVREAVAIALQYVGDADMPSLLKEMDAWSTGNWYEKRAVAAALAEPRLLKDQVSAGHVLRIFDKITASMASASDRKDESFKVLRQSMGYCWSV